MEFMLHKLSSFRFTTNCSSDVMVSLLASSAVDRGFEPRSGQTKDYKIGICRFSTKHAALRRKNKDWLARNHDNVSEWSNMSIRIVVSVNQHYKNPTPRVGLVQSGPRDHLIENLRSRHEIAEKLLNWHQTIITHSSNLCYYCPLALNTNQSINQSSNTLQVIYLIVLIKIY